MSRKRTFRAFLYMPSKPGTNKISSGTRMCFSTCQADVSTPFDFNPVLFSLNNVG